MSRKLPLYVETVLGSVQATRSYAAREFEKGFREDNPVSCKSGCAHCCYYPLLITIAEGIILYRALAARGKLTAALCRKLEEHADLTKLLAPAVWFTAAIPCPLLDANRKCEGYDARPLSCRLLFSSGDPADCDPQAFDPSSMAYSRDVMQEVAAHEAKALKGHRIPSLRMPVSRALLLAGKVLSGEQDILTIDRVLYEEYTRA